MKKIIVIGCPGSGKSTFSQALHHATGIPLYHLDRLYWNADRTTVEKSVFLQRLAGVLQKPEWIIDGNYGSTMEQRLRACDTVVFLDYPPELCLKGIRERQGQTRSDLPWVERDEATKFLAFVKDFPSQGRPQIMELLDRYPEKNVFIFQNRAEADGFLSQF